MSFLLHVTSFVFFFSCTRCFWKKCKGCHVNCTRLCMLVTGDKLYLTLMCNKSWENTIKIMFKYKLIYDITTKLLHVLKWELSVSHHYVIIKVYNTWLVSRKQTTKSFSSSYFNLVDTTSYGSQQRWHPLLMLTMIA